MLLYLTLSLVKLLWLHLDVLNFLRDFCNWFILWVVHHFTSPRIDEFTLGRVKRSWRGLIVALDSTISCFLLDIRHKQLLTYRANIREISQSSSSSSPSSTCSYNSPPNSNMSLPVIPVILPAALCVALAFSRASCSAAFFSRRFFFQVAKVSGVTGVRGGLSLCRSTSMNCSRDIWSFLAASSCFFLSDLSTKPGGRAWRYMHLLPPLGCNCCK